MYLRRAGWTDQRQFSIRTAAGARPTILSDTTCRWTWPRARRGHGRDLGVPYSRSTSAIRSARSAWGRRLSWRLALEEIGPPISNDARFPDRTKRVVLDRLAPDRIRARIFERGVGETASSGPAPAAQAVAHVLRAATLR